MIYLLFLILSLFFSSPVLAGNNLTITCSTGQCTTSPANLPLFSETNVQPGSHFYQQLKVVNTNPADDCHLYLSAQPANQSILPPVLINNLSLSSVPIYTATMESLFYSPNPVFIDTVPANTTYSYNWKLTMDQLADNKYQAQKLAFDLNLDFNCGLPPSPPPPPPPPPSPPGPSPCTAPAPGAPGNLTATLVSTTQVLLSWSPAPNSFTHYLIAFGPAVNDYRWGNPNIGSGNSYTVGSLTPGAQYCFYVRAVNDCMPGSASSPVCINIGSTIPSEETPPPGFQEGVLGQQATPTPVPTPYQPGQVEGQASCSQHWLPILWLLALLVNLIHYHNQIDQSPSNRSRLRHFLPPLVSFIAFLVDKILLKDKCCLIFPIYCRYFWLGNLFSWLIPLSYYRKLSK